MWVGWAAWVGSRLDWGSAWAALDFQSQLGGESGWVWVAACSGWMGGGCENLKLSFFVREK
jgi:hypothetical protein